MAKILVVDDEKYVCDFITEVFQDQGHEVESAMTFAQGRQATESGNFDVVFLDVHLPDGNGLDLLPTIRGESDPPEVIIITGYGDPQGAALAINNDAWDYIEKTTSPDKLMLTLNRVLQFRESKQARKQSPVLKFDGIIGASPAMEECFESLARAAATNANVLICGETGTGKELFASAVHKNSSRCENPFVIVDCASLPENLVESVLFGHEKGAFTGADRARTGLIKTADQGTLFLDEVGELPLTMQKRFLRVLENKRFRPIGGRSEEDSDFRLVSATHRDLDDLVEKNGFRKDLLYRLRSAVIHIPPLRDHMEDVKALAIHHMNNISDYHGVASKGFDPEVFKALACHEWPGNIRELVNVMEETFAAARNEPLIFPWHLPKFIRVKFSQSRVVRSEKRNDPEQPADVSRSLPSWRDAKRMNEQRYLNNLLTATDWNIIEASRISGLGRSQIYTLIEKHGLSREDDAPSDK